MSKRLLESRGRNGAFSSNSNTFLRGNLVLVSVIPLLTSASKALLAKTLSYPSTGHQPTPNQAQN